MPARAIQHEHEVFAWPCADCLGQGGQLDREEGDRDAGRQMPHRAARGGMHEADAVPPVGAMLHRRERALAAKAPDLLEDRLQPDTMFVDGPALDARVREGGGDGSDQRSDLFLNSACCVASAWTWRGRGLRHVPLRRTR